MYKRIDSLRYIFQELIKITNVVQVIKEFNGSQEEFFGPTSYFGKWILSSHSIRLPLLTKSSQDIRCQCVGRVFEQFAATANCDNTHWREVIPVQQK